MTEQTPEQKAAAERDENLRKSYASASKRLRENHADEFNSLRVEEAKKLGVDWTPPKSKEAKAEEEFARLIAENPFLAERLAEEPVAPGGGTRIATPEDEFPTG